MISHKDYVYQKKLGQQLPIDSFRFDFRRVTSFQRHTLGPHLLNQLELSGSHETPGRYSYGGLESDIVDVDVVVKHLKSKYGYVVTMMISHSRGSTVTMGYLCTHEEAAKNVKYFVNVSARYRMVSPSAVII